MESSRKPSLLEIYLQQSASLAHRINEERTSKLTTLKERLLQHKHLPNAYLDLANALSRGPEKLAVLNEALADCGPNLEIYKELVQSLMELNQTTESLRVAQRAIRLFPRDQALRFAEALALPIIYETPEQVAQYRDRFSAGLRRLITETKLDFEEARRAALSAVDWKNIFYLAYQAQNDRELQRQYGQLVHQIMAANYPQWVRSLEMPSIQTNERIRVGYVSREFRNHTVSKLFKGWLSEHDPINFELFAYYIGETCDPLTKEIERASDHFNHFYDQFDQTCERILADRLHILIFLEIGMYAPMMQLGGTSLGSHPMRRMGTPGDVWFADH